MMRRSLPIWVAVALALPLLASIAACEEDVLGVTGADQPFTMFGVLSPQLDTQWVRVFPIEGVLRPEVAPRLEAVMQSTDLRTGQVRLWNDSLFQEANGSFAHVFWSDFQALFDTPYSIDVSGDQGSTHVDVSVPPETELVLPEVADQPPTLFRVDVVGEVPRLIRIEITYRVRYLGFGGIVDTEFVRSYENRAERAVNGWTIGVRAGLDIRDIARELADGGFRRSDAPLKISRLTVRLIVANQAWDPPGGAFHPEVLVQPGLMSNVANGFGFVGAGYRHEGIWIPRDTVIVGDS